MIWILRNNKTKLFFTQEKCMMKGFKIKMLINILRFSPHVFCVGLRQTLVYVQCVPKISKQSNIYTSDFAIMYCLGKL